MLFTAPSVWETLPACLPAQLLLVCGHPMAGRVLKRIAREVVNVSLTLAASLPFNREFAPRSATQSVEKSDSVTPPLCWCHTVTHLEAHIQGQRASAREIEWRPVTLVKRFTGSAETQLTSRRDDGRCGAPRSSHPVTS